MRLQLNGNLLSTKTMAKFVHNTPGKRNPWRIKIKRWWFCVASEILSRIFCISRLKVIMCIIKIIESILLPKQCKNNSILKHFWYFQVSCKADAKIIANSVACEIFSILSKKHLRQNIFHLVSASRWKHQEMLLLVVNLIIL